MNRFLMMTALCLGAFVSHFTAGVINVSLPQFADLFNSDLATVQWITTGYLLVIASLLPLMGKLGDRYSHRTIHNTGYVVFALSSILIAFSSNIAILLILRAVQAVGASMFQATNIAIIALYLPKEQRGRALGIVSTAVALGAMSGPVAGGFIAEWLDWQWLFLVHVPVTLIATLLAFRYIPARRKDRSAGRESVTGKVPLDRFGAILFIISIASIVYAISAAQLVGFIIAIAGFTAFLLWELRQSSPFLPIRLFRIFSLSGGLIISTMSFMMANTVLVALPFYLTGKAGFSPSISGYIMAIYPILLGVAGPIAGGWSDRYGSKRLMLLGILGMALSLLVLALVPDQTQANVLMLLGSLSLLGIGMGLLSAPNNSFIMQHAPKEHTGSIGGMIALTRNLGMVIGAALGLGAMKNATAGSVDQEHISLLAALRPVLGGYILITVCILVILGLNLLQATRRQQTVDRQL